MPLDAPKHDRIIFADDPIQVNLGRLSRSYVQLCVGSALPMSDSATLLRLINVHVEENFPITEVCSVSFY